MIGFDYGTSNCAVGYMMGGQPEIVELGQHGRYMASSLYAPDREVIINWLADSLSEPLRKDFISKRQFLIGKGRETLEDLRLDGIETHLSFGREALSRYLDDPSEGYYIKSPKSFLGSTGLLPAQVAFFEHIVSAMMSHVKCLTESYLQKDTTQVVIGRPINFQGRHAEQSNKQAIEVLTNAAKQVGFKDIEFQYEPVAAGFDYEAQLNKETRVLVVDIGGGTTDCSMLLMGPEYSNRLDRSESLLGHAGRRVGGNDFDIQLALKGLMPNLGMDSQLKSGKPMPVNSFHEAVAINNVHAQSEFYSDKNGRFLQSLLLDAERPELFQRLIKVQKNKLSYQVVHSAEQTKIGLTDEETHLVDLSYLDGGLSQQLDRLEVFVATERELKTITELMSDAIEQAGCQPDVIFVTGGTAKSPVIRDFMESQFDNLPVVIGDHFGSVTAGLSRWSERIYR